MLKIAFVLGNILSLSFSLCFTDLLMFSVALLIILSMALLFMLSFTLLFRYLFTLLLWNRLSPGNLDSVTLLPGLVIHLSVVHSVAFLIILCVALLSGLIPALFLPDGGARRDTTVATTKQK